jgi:hypothetical protein
VHNHCTRLSAIGLQSRLLRDARASNGGFQSTVAKLNAADQSPSMASHTRAVVHMALATRPIPIATTGKNFSTTRDLNGPLRCGLHSANIEVPRGCVWTAFHSGSKVARFHWGRVMWWKFALTLFVFAAFVGSVAATSPHKVRSLQVFVAILSFLCGLATAAVWNI